MKPRNPFIAKAKANGISRRQYYRRVEAGWIPDDAATVPTGRGSPRRLVSAICRLIASIPVAPQQEAP